MFTVRLVLVIKDIITITEKTCHNHETKLSVKCLMIRLDEKGKEPLEDIKQLSSLITRAIVCLRQGDR